MSQFMPWSMPCSARSARAISGSISRRATRKWRGAASQLFLEHAARLVSEQGYAIGNVDLTLVCEAPRIGPHREAMRARLAEMLGTDPERVSVKATTTEQLGFTGRGEGIAAQAVATLVLE